MLRCVSRYSSSLGYFQPGDVVTDEALCAALAVDSPESFVPHEPAAPADAAVLEAPDHRAVTRRRKA